MDEIVNEVTINSDSSEVYAWCVRVERWPEIFPMVIAVDAQTIGENEVLMDMTVRSDIGVNCIRSHRRYDPGNLRIEFELLSVPDKVETMTGHWVVQALGDRSRLRVVHLVSVASSVPEEKRKDTLAQIRSSIFKNTELALSEIRKRAEGIVTA